VYPIPASGNKTVRVRYTWQLGGEDGDAVLSIPLQFDGKIGQFHLKVELVNTLKPSWDSSASDPAVTGINFSGTKNNSPFISIRINMN